MEDLGCLQAIFSAAAAASVPRDPRPLVYGTVSEAVLKATESLPGILLAAQPGRDLLA